MSERKTRRQAAMEAAAAAADADSTPTKSNAHGDMNGNSHAQTPITLDADDGPSENIFLFWPNLIGRCSRLPCSFAASTDD